MADTATIAAQSPRVNWPRWLLIAGRVILGAVFIYAAYTKLREPWMLFAMAVNSYQVLPEWAVTVVARSLPWFELALGLFLVLGWMLRSIASAAAILLAFFFTLMLYTYIKNPSTETISCGCFGFGEKLGPLTLARDASLLALALAIAIGAFLAARRRA
ncbi:MAG: MauE/DoxX family redox-associated membrane protein [Candidatus Acidiferrales bacterium]